MSTSGHLHRWTEQSSTELAKKKQSSSRNGCFAWREMWSVVRKLTPAEGLALVCLTSWVEDDGGLVQASDRQVCSETGVSRDVMKRLRRKLGAIGIQVTAGNDLSPDSCSYDFRKLLEIHPTPPAIHAGLSLQAHTPASLEASGLARASVPMPLHGLSGASSGQESGATPEREFTSCGPTVEIGYANIEFEVDLPLEWDDELEGKVDSSKVPRRVDPEEPVFRPLPPYEQWLARR